MHVGLDRLFAIVVLMVDVVCWDSYVLPTTGFLLPAMPNLVARVALPRADGRKESVFV